MISARLAQILSHHGCTAFAHRKKNFGQMWILSMLLFIIGGEVWAQQAPAFAHYWDMPAQYNPGAVGKSPNLNIIVAYQTHAVGYEDAGGTMYAGADMAFQLGRSRHGAGVLFEKDQIGLFAHQRFAVQYAYQQKLWGGYLGIGVQADLLNEKIDGTKVDLVDGNDPAFPSTELTGSKVGLSAGLHYQHKYWNAGFSVLNIMAPTVLMGETNEIKIKRLYNFSAEYNIRTKNPLFYIVPSTMLRFDGTAFRADVTARLLYKKDQQRIYGGVGYSPLRSVTLFVGGRFKGVDISYSYEANTEGIGLESGFHEVTLGYTLDLDFAKKGKNLHRSVRFL